MAAGDQHAATVAARQEGTQGFRSVDAVEDQQPIVASRQLLDHCPAGALLVRLNVQSQARRERGQCGGRCQRRLRLDPPDQAVGPALPVNAWWWLGRFPIWPGAGPARGEGGGAGSRCTCMLSMWPPLTCTEEPGMWTSPPATTWPCCRSTGEGFPAPASRVETSTLSSTVIVAIRVKMAITHGRCCWIHCSGISGVTMLSSRGVITRVRVPEIASRVARLGRGGAVRWRTIPPHLTRNQQMADTPARAVQPHRGNHAGCPIHDGCLVCLVDIDLARLAGLRSSAARLHSFGRGGAPVTDWRMRRVNRFLRATATAAGTSGAGRDAQGVGVGPDRVPRPERPAAGPDDPGAEDRHSALHGTAERLPQTSTYPQRACARLDSEPKPPKEGVWRLHPFPIPSRASAWPSRLACR